MKEITLFEAIIDNPKRILSILKMPRQYNFVNTQDYLDNVHKLKPARKGLYAGDLGKNFCFVYFTNVTINPHPQYEENIVLNDTKGNLVETKVFQVEDDVGLVDVYWPTNTTYTHVSPGELKFLTGESAQGKYNIVQLLHNLRTPEGPLVMFSFIKNKKNPEKIFLLKKNLEKIIKRGEMYSSNN